MALSQVPGISGDRVDRVVLRAMSRDASLEEEVARRLAAMALEQVAAGVEASDAPELARRLLDADPEAGASSATIVAAAVCDVLSEDDPAD